jgi:dynactin 1
MDTQEQLEMAMLDKEVAEERAEATEAELEEAKEKLAVLEVEMGVLKGERGIVMVDMILCALISNVPCRGRGRRYACEGFFGLHSAREAERTVEGSFNQVSNYIKKYDCLTEQGMIGCEICPKKLNKNNGNESKKWRKMLKFWTNFKVCLVEILATITQRNPVQYDEALIKLANAETEIEGLKLQLDDTLHAEDLLVKLTERNLELGEVCPDLCLILCLRIYCLIIENRRNACYN